MNGFNRIDILGIVTKEPEIKQTEKYSILNFRIENSQDIKKKDGGSFKEICYIDVVMFGQKALETASQLHAGSVVLVSGRLKMDSWKGKTGESQSKYLISADNVALFNEITNNPNNSGRSNSQVSDQFDVF